MSSPAEETSRSRDSAATGLGGAAYSDRQTPSPSWAGPTVIVHRSIHRSRPPTALQSASPTYSPSHFASAQRLLRTAELSPAPQWPSDGSHRSRPRPGYPASGWGDLGSPSPACAIIVSTMVMALPFLFGRGFFDVATHYIIFWLASDRVLAPASPETFRLYIDPPPMTLLCPASFRSTVQ
ncbi:uncharacterized protein BO80DRAFT_244024 [Aspergillus ibericus CBS 121593]|uniref:Uncharacterized protein n=1 Tax=Aspergillus ibericus CBS 121593 TaxID=1448316 RepID=A0A395GL38_9EURO|nr:hypothetical protein BO80DRAFT_244024 [Aspergillus ibericus CBS 121593]RAK96062.1 hypothetical protein BO80DRAFT_244024 [Aspergillus ibericus CBS 121593]